MNFCADQLGKCQYVFAGGTPVTTLAGRVQPVAGRGARAAAFSCRSCAPTRCLGVQLSRAQTHARGNTCSALAGAHVRAALLWSAAHPERRCAACFKPSRPGWAYRRQPALGARFGRAEAHAGARVHVVLLLPGSGILPCLKAPLATRTGARTVQAERFTARHLPRNAPALARWPFWASFRALRVPRRQCCRPVL